MASKLLNADQVAERIPGISRRTALQIIAEVGRVVIRHSAYCHEDALEMYIGDRTPSTFYTRVLCPESKITKARRRV